MRIPLEAKGLIKLNQTWTPSLENEATKTLELQK